MKRVFGAVRWFLTYVDLAAAAGIAVVITVLAFFNKVNGDTLTEAAVGLLAVLSFSLIRDRYANHGVRKAVEQITNAVEHEKQAIERATAAVARAMQEARSDYPYHTRSIELRYEILEPDGSLVNATKTREVRFTRNEYVIKEHHKADGEARDHKVTFGPKGGWKYELRHSIASQDVDGRPIEIVSLDRQCKPGEVMEIVTHRTLVDAFCNPKEYVNFDPDAPTDEVTFHVTWPEEAPPRALELVRSHNGQTQGATIPLTHVKAEHDGRQVLVETVQSPQPGERITLTWTWEPVAAPEPDAESAGIST